MWFLPGTLQSSNKSSPVGEPLIPNLSSFFPWPNPSIPCQTQISKLNKADSAFQNLHFEPQKQQVVHELQEWRWWNATDKYARHQRHAVYTETSSDCYLSENQLKISANLTSTNIARTVLHIDTARIPFLWWRCLYHVEVCPHWDLF